MVTLANEEQVRGNEGTLSSFSWAQLDVCDRSSGWYDLTVAWNGCVEELETWSWKGL